MTEPVPFAQIFTRQKFMLPLIVLGLGVCIAATAVKPNFDAFYLARDGIDARGDVLEIRGRWASSRRTAFWWRYSVLVRYHPEGASAPLTRRKYISRLYHDNLRVGGTVRLRYSAKAPSIVSVDPHRDATMRGWLNGLTAATISAALVLAGWMLWHRAPRIRALRHGMLRKATVTGLLPTERHRNRGRLHVLEWMDSEGQSGQSLPDERHRLARFKIGSTISVYIDPQTGRGWWDAQI
jgi:hypothetical protein